MQVNVPAQGTQTNNVKFDMKPQAQKIVQFYEYWPLTSGPEAFPQPPFYVNTG